MDAKTVAAVGLIVAFAAALGTYVSLQASPEQSQPPAPPPIEVPLASPPFGLSQQGHFYFDHDPVKFQEKADSYMGKATDMGVKWIRIHDQDPPGFSYLDLKADNFNWTSRDEVIKEIQKHGMEILFMIGPVDALTGWDIDHMAEIEYSFPLQQDEEEGYKEYVRRIVERYDGDNIDDMPGLKYPVKYWQLLAEVDARWLISNKYGENYLPPDVYLDGLKITHDAIRAADPEAVFMPGFMLIMTEENSKDYLKTIFSLNGGEIRNYIDIFAFHEYENNMISHTENSVEFVRNELAWSGPIWITEVGMRGAFDNETARTVPKYYAATIAKGVERIFWFGQDDLFTANEEEPYIGLKPASYTYALMTGKLENYSSVETINSGQYKFSFDNKDPVFVLWSDAGETVVDLTSYISSAHVLVTHIIEEENRTEPETEIVPTKAVHVNESPIFVEKKTL